MARLTSALFLVILAKAVFCSEDTLIGDLSEDVIDELYQLLRGTLQLIGQCGPPQVQQIGYLLYTRSNPYNPVTINISNTIEIDPTKKTIVLIHGWLASSYSFGFPELKDAYLQRYDCNVIMVDWSEITSKVITTAYCETPKAGELVADFLCRMSAQLGIPLSEVHLLGHSLGGQMLAFIGPSTSAICGQNVGRATGLDAGGLFFQGQSEEHRLDPTDANFVDAIQTTELAIGYYGNIGHVTFHVNCGLLQPGCPDLGVIDRSTLLNTFLSTVLCSHVKAVFYMRESVLKIGVFKAKSCASCPYICLPDIFNASYITMGEDCPPNPPRNSYWIPTNLYSPYAKGCTPYPLGCS